MGLIKFITVFDDEKQMVFSETILKRYNISAYPSVFFSDNKPYYDGLNADSSVFSDMKKHHTVVGPDIPSEIFQREYVKSYNEGYFAVVVICPHSKWFPYYDAAVTAANRLRRSVKYDFSTFRISVIDSKSFAAGVMLHALSMAHDHEVNHFSSELVVEFGRKNAIKNDTYILTQTPNAFCDSVGKLIAFRSFGCQFKKFDMISTLDSVKFDLFADTVCRQLKKTNSNYAVSIGINCEFAGNVIGRIIKRSGVNPICVMQYGIPSTNVLGDSSICVNFFK
ncbi:MAG: DegV family protein [Clostridia bacterium]|nr:DegV family protein [Clostridia bacterium]